MYLLPGKKITPHPHQVIVNRLTNGDTDVCACPVRDWRHAKQRLSPEMRLIVVTARTKAVISYPPLLHLCGPVYNQPRLCPAKSGDDTEKSGAGCNKNQRIIAFTADE